MNKLDMEYIRKLKLLDKGEKIYKFRSEYRKKVAGNFLQINGWPSIGSMKK